MTSEAMPTPLLYIDTNVSVLALETVSPVEPARALLQASRAHPGASATSVLTIAELLAPIKRPGAMTHEERRSLYAGLLLDNDFIRLVDVTRDVVLESARLRQKTSLKLPDSIHVACAQALGCKYFVSHDRDGRQLPAGIEAVAPTEDGVARLLEALADV